MTSKILNTMLVTSFPNLQENYLNEVSWQEGDETGSHTVYGDVLTPHLVDCIATNNIQEVKRIFDFLEEVLRLEDNYSDEVIAYSVLENIAYLFKHNDSLKSYLGQYTKKLLAELS